MRHVFGYDWMPSQTSQPLGSLDPEPLFRNSPGVPAMRAGLSRRLEPGAAASPLWRVQARLVPRGYIERHALWPRMTWNHQSNGLLPTLMPPNVRNLGWLNVIYLYIYIWWFTCKMGLETCTYRHSFPPSELLRFATQKVGPVAKEWATGQSTGSAAGPWAQGQSRRIACRRWEVKLGTWGEHHEIFIMRCHTQI